MTTTPKCIPVREIVGNLQVRRMAGRQLGRRKPITRATLIRWREQGLPAPIRTLPGDVELWDARAVRAWLTENRPLGS